MDERIKELAKRAYEDVIKNTPSFLVTKEIYEEKFAELIVKECAEVAIHKDDGMVSTADVAGYMAEGRLTAAKMIKKHFGVE